MIDDSSGLRLKNCDGRNFFAMSQFSLVTEGELIDEGHEHQKKTGTE